jgi:CrcB protein
MSNPNREPLSNQLRTLGVVALGGAVGGVTRYSLGAVFRVPPIAFVTASFVLNSLGSFVVAAIIERLFPATTLRPALRTFLAAGFVGGFTTAAAFTPEVLRLIQQEEYDRAGLYAIASILLANAFAIAGVRVGRSSAFRSLGRFGAKRH